MAIRSKFRSFNERTKDAVWAAMAAAALSFFGLLSPLDQFLWIYQSIVHDEQVSGDIVFATSKESLSDPSNPYQRERLAEALDTLATSEVDHIYLDVVFDRSSSQQSDRILAEAISSLGKRISVVRRVSSGITGETTVDTSLPEIIGRAPQFASARFINYLGFTWTVPLGVATEEGQFVTLPAALADQPIDLEREIPVNYDFDPSSIKLLYLDGQLTQEQLASLAGKKLLIGNRGMAEQELANIPGLPGVPGSYVSLFAAETIKAGFTREIPGHYLLLLVAFALVASVALTRKNIANIHKAYALFVLAIPAVIVASSLLHIRVGMAGSIALLFWYGALRVRSRWQKRFALEDDKTGLPTFRALEKAMAEKGAPPAIVVAKIHGYEEVVKALPPEMHLQYVRSLVDRFRVTETNMPIYANEGRYFGWSSPQGSRPDLETHLDGLRALFATPIKVGDTELDAGITFGVDMSGEPNPARRIASAVSIAEQTDEAHRPILFAEEGSQSDALWKLSLQGRIDQALERGDIYLVYQPKIDIESGQLVGVEALARWNDPTRGLISPAFFIRECERAGRMDHLTEYVLQKATKAAVSLRGHGIDAKMSVNISATLLRDNRVERMVKQVLSDNNLPAHLLVLEITETARILDLDHAVAVLQRLRDIGVSISIDDFGVGAANLETIYKLPLDELKIDRKFVADIGDPKARAVIGSMIAFGQQTGVSVMAEGAEDEETIRKLQELGCRIVQGYGISRPLEFSDIVNFQWDGLEAAKKNMV